MSGLRRRNAGVSLIVAHIVSCSQLRPGIKSADALLKDATQKFRGRCFTKASGLKKHHKKWKGK